MNVPESLIQFNIKLQFTLQYFPLQIFYTRWASILVLLSSCFVTALSPLSPAQNLSKCGWTLPLRKHFVPPSQSGNIKAKWKCFSSISSPTCKKEYLNRAEFIFRKTCFLFNFKFDVQIQIREGEPLQIKFWPISNQHKCTH